MVSLIAWVQHTNAHQALDDELGLEEILAVLCKSLWGEAGPVRSPSPIQLFPIHISSLAGRTEALA